MDAGGHTVSHDHAWHDCTRNVGSVCQITFCAFVKMATGSGLGTRLMRVCALCLCCCLPLMNVPTLILPLSSVFPRSHRTPPAVAPQTQRGVLEVASASGGWAAQSLTTRSPTPPPRSRDSPTHGPTMPLITKRHCSNKLQTQKTSR